MKNLTAIIFTFITIFLQTYQVNADEDLYQIIAEIRAENAKQSLEPMNSKDPYEDYNRAVFNFNLGFNDLIGEPIANAYNVLPNPVTTGIANFMQNLGEPLNVINALLQGKVEVALSSFMRFSLNSTLGLFGLIDIADEAGLKYQKEDLGQTLYTWGMWQESSFIMIPFIGAYTTRELIGASIDSTYNPTYTHIIKENEIGFFIGRKFVDYAKVVHLVGEMKKQPDPYIFMRESYLQHRTNLLYDGHPPVPEMDDFDFE